MGRPVVANAPTSMSVSATRPCGDTAGILSVFFGVDPLEEDVEQEVTSKSAKR